MDEGNAPESYINYQESDMTSSPRGISKAGITTVQDYEDHFHADHLAVHRKLNFLQLTSLLKRFARATIPSLTSHACDDITTGFIWQLPHASARRPEATGGL